MNEIHVCLYAFSFFVTVFVFGSMRQIKLAIRQLLGACKHGVQCRIVQLINYCL